MSCCLAVPAVIQAQRAESAYLQDPIAGTAVTVDTCVVKRDQQQQRLLITAFREKLRLEACPIDT